MTRFLRAAGAVVVLVVLVAGIPLGLASTIGNPLAGWADLQAGDVSDMVIVDVLAGVTWLAWAQFAWAVACEVVVAARHTPAPDLSGVRAGPQEVARVLVTAAFVALPVTAPVHSLPSPLSAHATIAAVAPPPAPAETALGPAEARHLVQAAPGVAAGSAVPSSQPATREETAVPVAHTAIRARPKEPVTAPTISEYMIRADGPGTFWDLAEAHLGQGQRWAEIWALNAGRVQDDGTIMNSPGLLQTGWTVLLPNPGPSQTGTTTHDSDRQDARDTSPSTGSRHRQRSSGNEPGGAGGLTYRVAPGDWLGSIAERFLGDFEEYPHLVATNRDLITAADGRTHELGVVGDHIEPGWRLTLPDDAHDRGAARHAAGHVSSPPQTRPEPRRGGSPSPDAPDAPPVRTHAPPPTSHPTGPRTAGPQRSAAASGTGARPGRHSLDATPSTPTVTPSSPTTGRAAAQPTDRPHLAPTPPNSNAHGNTPADTIPGGWGNLPLAGALLATAAVILGHRRHRHRDPTSLTSTGNESAWPAVGGDGDIDDGDMDTDLRPPPALTHSRRALREHAAATRSQASSLPPQEPSHVGDQVRMPAMIGENSTINRPHAGRSDAQHARNSDTDPAHAEAGNSHHRAPAAGTLPGSGLDLFGGRSIPSAGLGLDGPGAHAAARALLVAALTEGRSHRSADAGQVITTTETMRDLFPSTSPADPLAADALRGRVQVAPNPEQALTLLEGHLLEHHRTREHDPAPESSIDADDSTSLRTRSAPPLLLLTHLPPALWWARLNADLALGSDLTLSAVFLGRWQHGTTLTVATDGYATDSPHARRQVRRVAVLDEATAVDLLHALVEPHDPPSGQSRIDRSSLHPAPVTSAPPSDHTRTPAPHMPPQAAPNPSPSTDPAAMPRTVTHAPKSTSSGLSASDRVNVTLFGVPTIWDRHGVPVPGLRQHAGELLVYLALHRGGADLSELMEAFWPDAPWRRAGQRLSTEVANLRRTIRLAAEDTEIQPVINTGGRYHLAADLLDLDVWRLLDNQEHTHTAPEPGRRLHRLRAAVAAHTGVLADGQDYTWVGLHRETLRCEGIRARLALAAHPDTSPDEAAALLNAAADLDPTNEDLAQRTIQALTALGDTNAAHRRLQALRAALEDIDTTPAPDTTPTPHQTRPRDRRRTYY